MDSIMASYKPYILGIGEANFQRGHNINEAKLVGFTMHLGPGLDSLGVSRVAVFTKDS